MAKTADLTVEILRDIRDGVAATNTRLDALGTRLDARLDGLGSRLDETNANVAALARRQVESEVRLATEIVEVARAVNGVRDLLRERLDDRGRVDDHERRIETLERRGH